MDVIGGAAAPSIPAHSSLKSSVFSPEPPNAPLDLWFSINAAELPRPIIRTIETIQIGSTGKSLSSPSSSVCGPLESWAVLTLKIMFCSSYFELSPPDSTRIFNVAWPPASAFGAFTLIKSDFSAFEAKLIG